MRVGRSIYVLVDNITFPPCFHPPSPLWGLGGFSVTSVGKRQQHLSCPIHLFIYLCLYLFYVCMSMSLSIYVYPNPPSLSSLSPSSTTCYHVGQTPVESFCPIPCLSVIVLFVIAPPPSALFVQSCPLPVVQFPSLPHFFCPEHYKLA